jgi:hypothetical protein
MKVKLPPFKHNILFDEFDYYGASYVLSKYLNAKFKNRECTRLVYTHGWIPDYWLGSDPRIIYAQSYLDKNQLILVARESIKNYLISLGYRNVHSIGLPIVYLPSRKQKRIPGSLLVMPTHSLDYTKHNHWKFKEYVEEINKIKHNFQKIFICIHPSCIKNNYWVNEFKDAGYQIIQGIDIQDKNAIYRLKAIMESFEFITTNGFGSHIAYAAFFGAKVSIYGTFTEYKRADFINDPFYGNNPDILEKSIELSSIASLYNSYPHLFREPHLATEYLEWGRYEVGYHEKKSGNELLNILKESRSNSIFKANFKELLLRIIRKFYRVVRERNEFKKNR